MTGDVRRVLSERRVPPWVVRASARELGRFTFKPGLAWETQRRRLDRFASASPVPRGTRIVQTEINGVRSEVVTAPKVRGPRTVIHFHGGGYCVGSPRLARTWAAHLSAQADCQVILPDYRLAPENPYPAALNDAEAVIKAVLGQVGPGSIVLSGDSAGGGLALASILAARDAGRECPAGCLLLSPWLDLSDDRRGSAQLIRRDIMLNPGWLQACATAYAEPAEWTDPLVSPLLAAHKGLPPLLIQVGSDDLLAPDAQRLAASASAAEVDVTYTIWPRLWHDFALEPGLLSAADNALSQAVSFVASVTEP